MIEKKRKKSYFWLVAISVALVVVITGILVFSMDNPTNATITAVSSCLLPVIVLYQILNRRYMDASKELMTGHIAENLDYSYHEEGAFSIKDAQKHLIIPPHDSREIEDGLQGVYNGLQIAVQDVRLTGLHLKSAKAAPLVPGRALRGIMVRIRMNRSLSGHTVSLPHVIVPALYAAAFNGYQSVKASNLKYEKSYDILTTDTVEAKVVLNSGFADRLLEAAKLMKAGWMMISMMDNEMLLIFHCRGLELEPTPLWRPVTSDHMLKLTRPFDAIYKIADAIKANHQLG